MRQEEEDNLRKRMEEAENKAKESEEADKRRAKEANDMAKAELIKQQERDLLDTRSQPIRQYLMDNLVPFLTQGLIELCKKVPQDPVDNLADFLLAKADEIDNKKIKDREAVVKAKMEARRLKMARQ
jgi:adenylate kinase